MGNRACSAGTAPLTTSARDSHHPTWPGRTMACAPTSHTRRRGPRIHDHGGHRRPQFRSNHRWPHRPTDFWLDSCHRASIDLGESTTEASGFTRVSAARDALRRPYDPVGARHPSSRDSYTRSPRCLISLANRWRLTRGISLGSSRPSCGPVPHAIDRHARDRDRGSSGCTLASTRSFGADCSVRSPQPGLIDRICPHTPGSRTLHPSEPRRHALRHRPWGNRRVPDPTGRRHHDQGQAEAKGGRLARTPKCV